MVRIFEQVGGQPFEVQHVPEEALRAQYAASADPMQKCFAAMMISCAAGGPIDMSETLKSFPVQLRSVHEYARQVLGNA